MTTFNDPTRCVTESHQRCNGTLWLEIKRVFERFHRVDRCRSRAMVGTGLGLSTVRHVINLHGERIFVDSDLSKGSVFGFTLQEA